uniref:FXYD domain-containing ion transport regulator n=1 Tax=Mola mola TaxID=94237 RepID=A0A3Q3WLY4_MOLML
MSTVSISIVSPGTDIDYDADFVYDYYTLRVGGLVFAGIIVVLSVFLLAGNKIFKCGKSKVREECREHGFIVTSAGHKNNTKIKV